MKKALFIDRDGTLVIEPPMDYQLDSFHKLEFYPKVFRNLGFIRSKLDFEFVMVTNQDGLGTSSFPEDTFWPVHNLVLKTLEGEGITFDDIVGFMVIFLYFHLAFPSKFDQNTPEKDLTFSYPRAEPHWLQTRWGGHLLSYRAVL